MSWMLPSLPSAALENSASMSPPAEPSVPRMLRTTMTFVIFWPTAAAVPGEPASSSGSRRTPKASSSFFCLSLFSRA